MLDIQPESGGSVYVLNMNPKATNGVNIKITRKKNGKIKRVSYMSKKEEEKFFGNS